MTNYNININENTLVTLLTDRLNFWQDSISKDKYDLVYDLIENNPEFFTRYPEFDPKYIIDNLLINSNYVYEDAFEEQPEDYIYYRNGLYLLN